MGDIVWEFVYCSCIYESAASTISLHRTKKGAEIAMEFHKAEALKEFNEWQKSLGDTYCKFGEHEYWEVREREVQD